MQGNASSSSDGLSKLLPLIPAALAGFAAGFWVSKHTQSQGGGGSSAGGAAPQKRGTGGSRKPSMGRGATMAGTAGDSTGGDYVAPSGSCGSGHVVRAAVQCSNRRLLQQYENCGQPKIVVSCKSLQELNELKGRASGLKLPTYVVQDAGRTQVAAGSKTVLAIGPGDKASVDQVTRHLRLL
eukprot:jgi/Mesen1/5722/ME000289S04822